MNVQVKRPHSQRMLLVLIILVITFGVVNSPPANAAVIVSELSSINQLPFGQRITFDSSAPVSGRLADIENRFHVEFLGNPFLTGVLSEITGNADAPLSGRILELRVPPPGGVGPDIPTIVTVESTHGNWQSVGASFGASRTDTAPTLFLRVFGEAGQVIGEAFHQFNNPSPGSPLSLADYNKAVFFLGIRSQIPISSIRFETSNGVGVIDNLTFEVFEVPEPTSLVMVVLAGAAILLTRSRTITIG